MEKMTLRQFLNAVNGSESSIIKYRGGDALAAVERNGDALRYVREQTPDICKAAVERNGDALQYVKEQTPDICKVAVENDGYALRYVKEQTPDICKAAVENVGYALRYVDKSIFESSATVRKMTIAEVSEELGYKVEII